FVLPVVGRDREAPQHFAVLQADTIGIGLSAVLCVPREARVGERAEYALVPRGLRAAMPEDRDAELLERAPRPLEILEELCLAEPREVRVIVRVARDLVARVANPCNQRRGIEREASDDVVRRADAAAALDLENPADRLDLGRGCASPGVITLDVVERRHDRPIPAGQRVS